MKFVRLVPIFAILVACGDNREEVSVVSSAVIGDAAHGGRMGFYFLPPLAPSTELPPTFDDSLALTARVVDDSGAEIASVPLVGHEDHYLSHVDLDGVAPDPVADLRLAVSAGDRALGYADVRVFRSERTARSSGTDDSFELVDGMKLLVKVYANRCAAVDCAPASTCRAAATCDPIDGRCIAGAAVADGTPCEDRGTCVAGLCQVTCANAPNLNCGVVGSGDGTQCCQVGLEQKVCCGLTSLYARRICTATRPTCPDGGTYPNCTNSVYGCPAGSTACTGGCCVDCGAGQLNPVGGAGCAVCETPLPWNSCQVEYVSGSCVATVDGVAK